MCPYITYAIGTPVADCAYFSRRAKEENKKKAQRLQKDEWKEKEKEEEAMAIVEVEQDGYEKEHDNAAEWNDFWGTEIQNMDENDNWEDKDKVEAAQPVAHSFESRPLF